MRGVCIVALGHRIYGEMALNLAASLRVVSPNIQIALLYDDDGIQTLNEDHLKLFNQHIKVGGAEITVSDSKHYQFAKLLVYKYSPFDLTIYIDADTLWGTRPIESLFDDLQDKEFYIGAHSIYTKADDRRNILGYTFWCEPYEACTYHGLEYIQQTISGLFYFKKGETAKSIFALSEEVFADQGAPNFIWANGKPDEYCFNVALSKLGFKIDRNCLIYFDKMHGTANEDHMFSQHWGIAIGGHKITRTLKMIYDRRAEICCAQMGVSGFRAVEKYIAIPSRSNEKNAVQL